MSRVERKLKLNADAILTATSNQPIQSVLGDPNNLGYAMCLISGIAGMLNSGNGTREVPMLDQNVDTLQTVAAEYVKQCIEGSNPNSQEWLRDLQQFKLSFDIFPFSKNPKVTLSPFVRKLWFGSYSGGDAKEEAGYQAKWWKTCSPGQSDDGNAYLTDDQTDYLLVLQTQYANLRFECVKQKVLSEGAWNLDVNSDSVLELETRMLALFARLYRNKTMLDTSSMMLAFTPFQNVINPNLWSIFERYSLKKPVAAPAAASAASAVPQQLLPVRLTSNGRPLRGIRMVTPEEYVGPTVDVGVGSGGTEAIPQQKLPNS